LKPLRLHPRQLGESSSQPLRGKFRQSVSSDYVYLGVANGLRLSLKVVSPTFVHVGLNKAGEAAISSLVAAVSLQFLNWTATPTHGAWQNVSRPQGAAEAERAVLIE
jgi:hypothetical protein